MMRHVRMQQGRRFLYFLQESRQFLLTELQLFHLLHHAGGRVVVTGGHDELHQLIELPVNPFPLGFGLIDQRPPFHAEPIHLAGELVTEFLEQRGFHKVMP
ncbi:hypothetical protein [Brucella sp. 2716]|uniref:hypothetical protein n=1 Tax=Brucella sp. 2716 TaxID=2975052 RepID=UPI00217E4882|nr:hypothetical protein [Brucella sp. 2716]UWF60433.1 hypothetical protein NYO66_15750 [Brucella sp. 2716]